MVLVIGLLIIWPIWDTAVLGTAVLARNRAQWIQCEDCGDWAHVEYAKFGPRGNFPCDLCDD